MESMERRREILLIVSLAALFVYLTPPILHHVQFTGQGIFAGPNLPQARSEAGQGLSRVFNKPAHQSHRHHPSTCAICQFLMRSRVFVGISSSVLTSGLPFLESYSHHPPSPNLSALFSGAAGPRAPPIL